MELFRIYFQTEDGFEVEYYETIKRGALSWSEAMDVIKEDKDIFDNVIKPYLKPVKE